MAEKFTIKSIDANYKPNIKDSDLAYVWARKTISNWLDAYAGLVNQHTIVD